MLGRTDSRLRMVAILLVFAVFGMAAGLRLGYWQVIVADGLTAQVKAAKSAQVQKPVRADIVDRDGVLLAKTASFDRLDAYPDIIDAEDHPDIVDTLGILLDLNASERATYFEQLADASDKFEILRDRLTLKESAAVAAAMDAGLLPGIALTPKAVRHYPRPGGQPGTSLASHLVGFVRADGRPGDGMESYYDERLTTVDPASLDLASIDGLPGGLDGIDPPPLKLTIDAKLQKQVEKELNTAFIANRAESASAVVMDPHTGAILAAATVPSYDANDFAAVATEDMSRLRNRAFSDQYEPGSVMKIFTAAAAIHYGVVTPQTIIRDEVKIKFYEDTVQNSDHKSLGPIPVKDVIARSRNVAVAKIAKRLAPNSVQRAAHRLYDFWELVGMAGRTGVDVANEAKGAWYDPDDYQWAPVGLANRAFGQGVSVTLPQLARGVSTLVNGGYVVQPHIVADGEAAQVEPKRVIKAKVARQARDILTYVTGSVEHYARGSLIPGYEIGGKTGTAQIWDVNKWNKETKTKGAWKERRFNHSFVGFVGGRKQEVVIAVRLEEPVPNKVGQGYIPLRIESYQLFQMVARASIKHLDLKKSKDKSAGRPIIGTPAAKALDPVRNREALKQAKQEARREERQDAKAAKTEKAKRRQDDKIDIATDGEPEAGSSGSDSP
ncbi:MAG: penicillin-binding protein 2 [Chloroflexota bacterium]|nr:penicillin-binding protein 2 [Chloroflexota bacterium]